MKRDWILLLCAALGGCAALVLRLLENRFGFEADTGLPIAWNVYTLALLALLGVYCLGAAALSLLFSKNCVAFPFSTGSTLGKALCIAGCALLVLSGGAEIAEGLFAASKLSDSILDSLCGTMIVLAAAGLFQTLSDRRGGQGNALLWAPAAMSARLVADFRTESTNPLLARYAPELAALCLLSLGFFQLSSFPFNTGSLRRFALYAAVAAPLCLCAAADGGLADAPLFVGGALVLMGFFLFVTQSPLLPEAPASQA